MKTSLLFFPALVLSLAACSDSAKPAASPAAAAPTEAPKAATPVSTPAAPSSLSALPGSVAKARDVVAANNTRAAQADAITMAETPSVTTKAVAAAKEAFPALLEQLKSQAAKSNSARQPKIADLLGGKVGALTSSFTDSQKGLGTGVEGLLGGLIKGDSGGTLQQLGGLLGQTGVLDSKQQGLVGEVRNLASAWLLDKQFAGTPLEGKAGPLIDGLMNNQWAQSLLGLKNLGSSKDLNGGQKGLLDSLIQQFAPEGLKSASGALDLLKGLGK